MNIIFIKQALGALIVTLTLLTLSFYILKFQGFAISLALIFNLYHLSTNPIQKKDFRVIIAFILFFMFNLIYQIWAINFVEFFKTFFLFLLAIFTFLNLPRARYPFLNYKIFKFIIIASALAIIFFEILQIIDFFYFGSTKYYFLFDSISISTAESADRFQAVNLLSYIRPVSFYHEPSYLGSVLFLLLIASIHLKLRLIWSLFIFIGIVGSLSMTVYVFTVLYLLYIFRRYYVYFLILFTVLSFYYLYKTNIGFDFLRLGELSMEGSSGNERIIAPFYSIIYEFNYVLTITGRALGQTRKQLDNSFYVLLSYFGIFLPLLLFLIKKHVKSILKDSQSVTIFLIFFGNMLFLNGAIITPESQFMLFFLFVILKLSVNSKNKILFSPSK